MGTSRPQRRGATLRRALSIVGLLSIVLGLAGFGAVTPVAQASGAVDAFVAKWNGKHADYDGAYGAQCVDLFNFYNRDVVGAPRIGVGTAAQLFNAAPASHYLKLSAGTAPRKGDVAVWGTSWPYTSAGHVAIVLGDQGGNISVLTQNPGATKVASMTKAHLTGYLRPRNLSSAPAAPAGANPVGHIDEVSSPGNGQVRVRGWAFDPDNSGASIEVHAYVGGPAVAAGAEGYPLRAAGSRPDVNNVHRIGGNHGFNSVLNTSKVGSVNVCLYAINIGGGGNVHLGCRTVKVGDPTPKGHVDEVKVLGFGKVKVRGWSFDPDASSTSNKVHIYIGAQPGQAGAKGVEIGTTASRPDVNRTFAISGTHGFDKVLSTKARGSQKVCAYAINLGNGNHNPQIGCKTITLR